ncbi:MFS transporter [Marinobacteraceae bacterium S3BR75-40.1]
MASSNDSIDQLYAFVANEEDARVCKDISDDACREVPRNFFLMLGSLVLTKLGDLLISPKTVLAWLMATVGAPAALTAWLVPIRESGSLIPQLVIGAWVRSHAKRKGFWVAGSVIQSLCVLGMALCVGFLEGTAAGLGIIGLLILFSLARGFCSVAQKDVQGKTIPKTRRGRLSGLATTVAGIGTALITVAFFWQMSDPSLTAYMGLLITGGLLWLVAALTYSQIDEYPGATSGGGNAFSDALKSLSLLRDDRTFRHFVIARALLLCSALAAPFFVILAQNQGQTAWLLGGFLLASSLASSTSASVWGWMADASSRQVMIRGAAIASVTCLLVGAASVAGGGWITSAWFYPVAFFVLSIAHAGVRLGRKTYLVDMATGNQRTHYTSVSNTVIGLLLLVTGGISALASLISPGAVILLLGLMGVAGVIASWRLPEVE